MVKKLKAGIMAIVLAASFISTSAMYSVNADGQSYKMNVAVDVSGEKKPISPYIYGINEHGDNLDEVTAGSVRQGGNRFTAYNWENNYSNAGSDWYFSSDTYLSSSSTSGACAIDLSEKAEENGVPYKMTTLQMAGYVAADKNGSVSESEAAPSARWDKVEFSKGSEFSLEPDLTDGVVYMDEYVNYLVKTLGDSTTSTGYQAYSLDNEPALWNGTHKLIQPDPVSPEELVSKSVELSKAVKAVDANAEIFGPALYGYTAYAYLADEAQWKAINSDGRYHWFIDYYLDEMKKASENSGQRLLDVLDVHYYSESSKTDKDADIVQSVRTLYEKGFAENSWIGQWCQENVPILPTIQKSIDTYYPKTKLAISEYDFKGGDRASGAVAQVEALGCYADNSVYYATLWGEGAYQYSGINLYTNYDGKGSSFGDTLLKTETDDVSLSSAYASVNSNSEKKLTMSITNKDSSKSEETNISINNSDKEYKSAAVYGIYGETSKIRLIGTFKDIADNKLTVTLPAMSASMVVFDTDANAFDDTGNEEVTEREVTIDGATLEKDADGKYVIPIDEPKNLKELVINYTLSCTSNSAWCGAGGGISFNALDENGKSTWAYLDFSATKGTGDSSVKFKGKYNRVVDDTAEEFDGKLFENEVKLELWWSSSDAINNEQTDTITFDINKITLIYNADGADIIKGDVTGDGKVDSMDAVMIKKFILNKSYMVTEDVLKRSDVSGDGYVTVDDLKLIKEYVLGKIETL